MSARPQILCALFILSASSVTAQAQVARKDLDSVIWNLNLEEVVVSAKKVERAADTVSFYASTYAGKEDIVLEDVLRKMPGIEITGDGQIIYNGQWIKDFYVEGMDMLGGNYGVATRNLDAQDISAVQVIEDHQGIKLLQGRKRGDAPAINIKLKSTAKGAWASSVSAALGSQPHLARDISANLMTFRQKMQHITVLKTNDIGTDLRKEIQAPSSLGSSVLGTGLILPGSISISDTYSYRNDSYSASVNQLHKLGEDATLSFNVNYLYDDEAQDAADVTTYLSDNDSLPAHVVSESNHASVRQHYIGGHLVYKLNSGQKYLNNNLSFSASLPAADGLVNGAVDQRLSGHNISVDNILAANYKRRNGAVADVNWHLSYDDRKGSLGVTDTADGTLSQTVRQQVFMTDGSASILAITAPHVMFNLDAGFDARWQRAATALSSAGGNGSGTQQILQLGAAVSPRLLLHWNKFQWTVSAPIGVTYFHSTDGEWRYDKPLLSLKPYTALSYKPSSRVSIDLTAICGESMPQPLSLMAQQHYTNYRTTMSNPHRVEAVLNRTLSTSLSAAYNDVFSMFFGNLALVYAWYRNGISTAYSFTDDIINYVLLPRTADQSTWQVSQSASKGFFLWSSKISESLSIGTTKGDYYVGDAVHEGRSDYLQASLSYSASFARWISFETGNSYSISKPYTDGQAGGVTYHTFSSTASLGIWPLRQLRIAPSVQYYFNNYYTDGRHNVFLDCSLEYYWGRATISLRCANLLDNNTFRRINDNGIIRYSSEYRLRGRTLMLGLRIKIL